MKNCFILLLLALATMLMFGCSESPTVSNSPVDYASLTLVQRPQFIDTRPTEVIENFVMKPDVTFASADKKPPKPPPDTGGTGDDPNPNPANKYAYIVGISNYEGTGNDLNYCDDDARDMKAYLQGEGFTCRMDLDLSATADNIVAGLNWLVANAEPGDEIVFNYSGHGVKYRGYGSCLISSDLYYVSHSLVMDIFNSANCTKKLVAIDACQIGSFLSDGDAGSFVATASNSTYSYDAPDLGNGAWTYYWLEGTDQFTYAEDIAPYAEDGMKAWAKLHNVRVSPSHTDSYSGMFDI